MYRIYEDKINDWLDNKKSALLVTGARQIGKTYTIRDVLSKRDIPYFEINFYERPDLLEALRGIQDPKDFIAHLRLYSDTTLVEGKSVIFFDEVQAFPEIITKIKFLVDDGAFRYILSGSLLGVELKNIRSIPVGYMDEIKMYPMNFREFALALGVKGEELKHIDECYRYREKVDDIIHTKMLNIFNYYLVTGGMPKVVSTFVDTKNLSRVTEEQLSIINQYKVDFSKYESDNKKLKIISIYDNMASQLNKQNLKFVFTYLNKELKFDRYENSFLWLKEAGVAYPTYIANEIVSPLVMSKAKNNFKLFFSDVGLLVSYYPFSTKVAIIENSKDIQVNKGALYENFVAEELKANNLEPYYYKSKAVGELDFLVETDLTLNVLEVKSGNDYKRHKALDNLLSSKHNDLNAIVFSPNNVEKVGSVTYLPIYMAGCIKNEEIRDYKIDF